MGSLELRESSSLRVVGSSILLLIRELFHVLVGPEQPIGWFAIFLTGHEERCEVQVGHVCLGDQKNSQDSDCADRDSDNTSASVLTMQRCMSVGLP